jgi:hypothetical protein
MERIVLQHSYTPVLIVCIKLCSADPFDSARVSTFSKSFETYQNVGLYGLSDCVWFLKVE